MATHKLIYDRTYQQGDGISTWQTRLRLILQSCPFWTAGAISDDANLTANSLANVKIGSVSEFNQEIDANNQPGLRKFADVTWEMQDTPAWIFRTNIINTLITNSALGLRLVCYFDCDYGTGTWQRDFTGVVMMREFEHDNIFLDASASQEDYLMKFHARDYLCDILEQTAMTADMLGNNGLVELNTNNPITTTVVTGATSAVQHLASTANMFIGEPLEFNPPPGTPIFAYIKSIDSSTQVTLSLSIATTTGWTVTAPLFVSMTTNVYRAGAYLINKAVGHESSTNGLDPWKTAFDSTPYGTGEYPDRNFACIASVLKAFALLYAWSVEGSTTLSDVNLAFDFIGDHIQLNGSQLNVPWTPPPVPTWNVAVGYNSGNPAPLGSILTAVYYNEHTFLSNYANYIGFPVPGTSLPYREFNVDAMYRKGTGYLNNLGAGGNTGGNCATCADSLKLILEDWLLYANFYVTYNGSNQQINLRAVSPLSPTIEEFITGSPELIFYKDQYNSFPGFTPAGSASASIKKPPLDAGSNYMNDAAITINGDGTPAYFVNNDNTQFDNFNPTYTNIYAKSAGSINITQISAQFWDDWAENQVIILFDPTNIITGGGVQAVVCADYSFLLDMGASAYPSMTNYAEIITAKSLYSFNNPVIVTQTWGGGQLNLGTTQVAKVPTKQHGIAIGAYSLYCGGMYGAATQAGMEKIYFETKITTAMDLQDALLKKVRQRGYDLNLYNYMITGISWNSWNLEGQIRGVKITAVRSIGY